IKPRRFGGASLLSRRLPGECGSSLHGGVTLITVLPITPCEPAPVVKHWGVVMGYVRKALIAAHVALALSVPLAQSAAAATFDGEWSVRIASPKPECGNGATLSIGISNGRVASNNAVMQASGHVADGGTISVSLMSGI